MGLVNALLLLKNPRKSALRPVELEALADTGSVHLRIPDHARIQLEHRNLNRQVAVPAGISTCQTSTAAST